MLINKIVYNVYLLVPSQSTYAIPAIRFPNSNSSIITATEHIVLSMENNLIDRAYNQ